MAEVGNSDIAGNGSQAPAPSGARMCYSGWSYPFAEPCLFFKVTADSFLLGVTYRVFFQLAPPEFAKCWPVSN